MTAAKTRREAPKDITDGVLIVACALYEEHLVKTNTRFEEWSAANPRVDLPFREQCKLNDELRRLADAVRRIPAHTPRGIRAKARVTFHTECWEPSCMSTMVYSLLVDIAPEMRLGRA